MTHICGVDEAGRGPLCGPVFASAVILDNDLKIKNLDDSKKITPKKRNEIYEEIKIKSFEYTFASASVEEIDELNILNASLLAMKRAILKLNKMPIECYVDGLYVPKIEGCNLVAIIKGDSLIPSISAASIVAAHALIDASLTSTVPKYLSRASIELIVLVRRLTKL